MAKIDEKVMSLVEEELKKKPGASVDELYDKAVSANSAIGKLTKRQFNARYPLQVKRKKNAPSRSGRKKTTRRPKTRSASRKSDGSQRDAVRSAFLKFASDLAGAEARKDVVKVVAGVDKYVDDAIKAMGK